MAYVSSHDERDLSLDPSHLYIEVESATSTVSRALCLLAVIFSPVTRSDVLGRGCMMKMPSQHK